MVAARFDLLHTRFKDKVLDQDYRIQGLLDWLGPLNGLRVLDVGSGKGRFAREFGERGANVIGLDLSMAMLAEGSGLDRVRGSARRLPFASARFDIVVAVEVLEHISPLVMDATIKEIRRVLKPDGRLAILDKNAASLNSRRPWLPNLLVKHIDQRRGLWMYPGDSPVQERWFWPNRFRSRLQHFFHDVSVLHLLSPAESQHRIFRMFPQTRCMTLWGAQASGRTLNDV